MMGATMESPISAAAWHLGIVPALLPTRLDAQSNLRKAKLMDALGIWDLMAPRCAGLSGVMRFQKTEDERRISLVFLVLFTAFISAA